MVRRTASARTAPAPADAAVIAAELATVRADRDALLAVLARIAQSDAGFTRSLCRAIAHVAVSGERFSSIDGYVNAACRHMESSR